MPSPLSGDGFCCRSNSSASPVETPSIHHIACWYEWERLGFRVSQRRLEIRVTRSHPSPLLCGYTWASSLPSQLNRSHQCTHRSASPPLPHARSARRGRTFTLPGVSAVLRGHVHSIRPFCILFWSHVAWHSDNAGIICSVIEMERCVLIGPSLNADVIPTPALSMLCQRLASPHGDLWSEPKRRRSIGCKCHGEWREMASTDFCRLSIARPAIISQE